MLPQFLIIPFKAELKQFTTDLAEDTFIKEFAEEMLTRFIYVAGDWPYAEQSMSAEIHQTIEDLVDTDVGISPDVVGNAMLQMSTALYNKLDSTKALEFDHGAPVFPYEYHGLINNDLVLEHLRARK